MIKAWIERTARRFPYFDRFYWFVIFSPLYFLIGSFGADIFLCRASGSGKKNDR